MENSELYHRTVDILAKAYVDETLEHKNCFACAVGNLVAANCGWRMINQNGGIRWDSSSLFSRWQDVFCTEDWGQYIHEKHYTGEAKAQIDSTGYHYLELAQIENVFETTFSIAWDNNDPDPMYAALLAVIAVLDKIHKVTDQDITKRSKEKFVRI